MARAAGKGYINCNPNWGHYEVYGLSESKSLDCRVDMAAGKGYINPAVQDLARGQSINLHSARSWGYYCFQLRIKIRFLDVHRVMKPIGGANIVEFSDDYWLHHPMNVENSNFNSYIYTLFLDHFCTQMLWCKLCFSENLTNVFGHNVKQPSSWLDVSRTLFWPNKMFVYPWHRLTTSKRRHMASWPLSVYEASLSEMVHLRKVSGKCKYCNLNNFAISLINSPGLGCIKL